MMPNMSLSASSSASSKGGDGAFGGSSSAIQQGDWNVSTGKGTVAAAPSWMMMAAIGLGALWIMKKRK
jgi:LPXTG-motif cell wall-anchored protein